MPGFFFGVLAHTVDSAFFLCVSAHTIDAGGFSCVSAHTIDAGAFFLCVGFFLCVSSYHRSRFCVCAHTIGDFLFVCQLIPSMQGFFFCVLAHTIDARFALCVSAHTIDTEVFWVC